MIGKSESSKIRLGTFGKLDVLFTKKSEWRINRLTWISMVKLTSGSLISITKNSQNFIGLAKVNRGKVCHINHFPRQSSHGLHRGNDRKSEENICLKKLGKFKLTYLFYVTLNLPIMERVINHEWFYPQDPETVWTYLTDPELIKKWLMPTDFKPIVGHQFNFTALPKPKFGFDGKIYCEVLEIIPLKRLSYSWKGGWRGKITLDSVVTWTLTPKSGGTLLSLEQTGFKGIKNFIPYLVMNKGWVKISKRIFKDLEQQPV
jgi:uncharacterized protein YndB with AHSA1/START domain